MLILSAPPQQKGAVDAFGFPIQGNTQHSTASSAASHSKPATNTSVNLLDF